MDGVAIRINRMSGEIADNLTLKGPTSILCYKRLFGKAKPQPVSVGELQLLRTEKRIAGLLVSYFVHHSLVYTATHE
jgi:hypothetical protein